MLRYELPVTFNGVLLNDFITPSFSTDTGMLPETSDSALSFAEGIGERFTRRKYGTRTIKIPYAMHNPTEAKRQSLIEALAVTEPKKLTVGRTPDRYYLAIPKNSEFTIGGFRTSGTLEFICYDGVSHSNDITTVTGQSGTDITVSNAGTAPSAPVLTATMTADNGLVAWTNDQGGVLQFGDPGEVDGVITKAPEVVLTEGFDSDPGGTVNSVLTNYPNYGGTEGQANVQTGSMSYGGKYVGATAMAPEYGAKAAYWGGPSLLLPFPANSHGANTGNIVTYTRQYFDTDVSKMGRMEVSLSGDGSIVFESVLRDSMAGGDQIVWECWYGSQLMASTVLNRKTFSNGHLYELRIWRFSTVIGFQLARVASVTDNVAKLAAPLVKTFNITSREPIDSVGFWFCRWQDRTAPTMGVTDFKGQWTDVDEWNDFANRFSAGDVVVADVANKRIMVNGVEDMTLHRVGNTWDSFWIKPGANTIRPVASDWATPFDATVEYREAWL